MRSRNLSRAISNVVTGYLAVQQGWVLWQLATKNVAQSLKNHRNEAPPGLSSATAETTRKSA